MTKRELKAIFEIAKSNEDLSKEDLSVFDGYGLPGYDPVYVTKRAVAALIRWQALLLNGEWDLEELSGIGRARRKFIILD